MPRVRALTFENRLKDADALVCERCVHELFKAGIKKKEVAKVVGISEPALSQQISKRKMSLEVVLAIISMTNADANKIMKVE